jgi:hypothetical protein
MTKRTRSTVVRLGIERRVPFHCTNFPMLGVCTPGFTVWVAISSTLVELSPPLSMLMPRARRASSFCPVMTGSIGDVVLL